MEKTNIITLDDDREYIIVSKTTINHINYYYLIDIHEIKNIKFCQEERDGETIILKEITDPKVIQNLIKIMYTQEANKE